MCPFIKGTMGFINIEKPTFEISFIYFSFVFVNLKKNLHFFFFLVQV